ncbi:MAG: hypothetical protein QM652_12815, partial [Legionella sp.]
MPNFHFVKQIAGPSTEKFIIEINNDIEKLNILIDHYNKTIDPMEQINALKKVYCFKQQIENKHSDRNISKYNAYQNEIQNNLFIQLQSEFKKHGIHSMYNISTLNPSLPIAPHSPYALPVILADMMPEKANKLLEILSAGAMFNVNELKKLYSASEPGFVEYQHFLNNNGIQFLGGSNSKNFKIIPNDGSSPFVLKIENRMGMPKWAEEHLRVHSLREIFTPVLSARQASCVVNGTQITRTLLITEFCSGGDLEAHSKTYLTNYSERIKSALNIYHQMATILMGISNDQCAFPDMKNTNWLIESSGMVRLADTKSFVPVDSDDHIDKSKNEEIWFHFLSTKFMNPPEFAGSSSFSADKIHSFMLGKNLYQYLSGCNHSYLKKRDNASTYDFSSPVFNNEEGKELKQLIEVMVQPNPNYRISVKQSLLELEKIQCRILLREISSYPIPISEEEDVLKAQFIDVQKTKIYQSNCIEDLQSIKKDLNAKLLKILQFEKAQCDELLKQLSSNSLGAYDTQKN